MEVWAYSYFWWCEYFWGPWVSFVTTDEFSVRVTKITSRIGVSWTHNLPFCFWPFLTQWIMAILSKAWKPDNFGPHNSLKLSFQNIWGLYSNCVECESLLESNSSGILALRETNLDDSTDSGNFSVRDSLNLKRFCYSYAWFCSLCERRTCFCTGFISWKLCRYLLMFPLLHSLSYFFVPYQSPSLLSCTVFDSVSSNINEALSINPFTNVFVFGDCNVHHKD